MGRFFNDGESCLHLPQVCAALLKTASWTRHIIGQSVFTVLTNIW